MKRPLLFLPAIAIGTGMVLLSVAAHAQQANTNTRQGRTAEVDGVEVGQRIDDRKRPEVRSTTARVNNRVQNRVENRIQNRIDRSYVEQTDSTASYEQAEKRTRTTQEPR